MVAIQRRLRFSRRPRLVSSLAAVAHGGGGSAKGGGVGKPPARAAAARAGGGGVSALADVMAETLGDPVFDGREHLQPAVVHDPDFRAVGVQHRLGSSVVMRPSRDFRTRAQLIDRIARACSVLDILCYQLRRLAGCPFPGEIQSLLRLTILVRRKALRTFGTGVYLSFFSPFLRI